MLSEYTIFIGMSYKVRIECGNCCSRNNYEVQRGITCNDADLICPNCSCCPTAEHFSIITDNDLAKHNVKSENQNLKGNENGKSK